MVQARMERRVLCVTAQTRPEPALPDEKHAVCTEMGGAEALSPEAMDGKADGLALELRLREEPSPGGVQEEPGELRPAARGRRL